MIYGRRERSFQEVSRQSAVHTSLCGISLPAAQSPQRKESSE